MIDSGMNRNGYHIIIGGFVSIQLSCIYQSVKGHIDLFHSKYFKHILNCKTESLILTLFFSEYWGIRRIFK